jgi:hypothetical protein
MNCFIVYDTYNFIDKDNKRNNVEKVVNANKFKMVFYIIYFYSFPMDYKDEFGR